MKDGQMNGMQGRMDGMTDNPFFQSGAIINIHILQGYWFYALLLCLEKPLLPDACSLIRGLARSCANLRASLVSFLLVYKLRTITPSPLSKKAQSSNADQRSVCLF